MKKSLKIIIITIICLSMMAFPIDIGYVYAADVVASGTCGENITWTLNDEGTLTISGNGIIGSKSNYSQVDMPWDEYSPDIKTITINEGITKVEAYSFYSCNQIERIYLPNSIEFIGAFAFGSLNNKQVFIPSADVWINIDFDGESSNPIGYGGGELYINNELITNIEFPDGSTNVKPWVFQGCNQITSVTLPETIDSIGEGAFYGTSIESISIPNEVKIINDWTFGECIKLKNVSIPNGVYKIKSYSFAACEALENIKLPERLTTIEYRAFRNCSSLKSVYVPDRVTALDSHAFSDCASLENMSIRCTFGDIEYLSVDPSIIKLRHNVADDSWDTTSEPSCTNNGRCQAVCLDCGGTITEEIPAIGHDWNEEYTVDKEASCIEEGSKSIHCSVCNAINESTVETIPKADHIWEEEYTVDKEGTCTEEGSKSIHCSVCNSIDEATVEAIPKVDHKYGDWRVAREASCVEAGTKEKVCEVCENKIMVEIPATGHKWNEEYTVDKEATCAEEGFRSIHCSVCNSIDEATLEAIPKVDHKYGDWRVAKEASCVEAGIKEKVCEACEDKITEEIPATGHKWNEEYTVDEEATCLDEGSESIHCSVCNSVKEGSIKVIGKSGHSLIKVGAKEATFAEDGNIEYWNCSICDKCFGDSEGVNEITADSVIIPKTGGEIIARGKCGVDLIWALNDEGTLNISGDGEMAEWRTYSYVPWSAYTDTITNVIIDNRVTSIGNYAFYNCTSLASITIPEGITSIGGSAFYNCKNLKRVDISNILSYLNIQYGDNYNSHPSYYGALIYINDEPIKDVLVPDGVTIIPNCAFKGCNTITRVEFPESLKTIGSEAFRDCKGIKGELNLPNTLESIGNGAFWGCIGISGDLIIPDNVTVIENYTFYGCKGFDGVLNLPESLISIGSSAFYGCSKLSGGLCIPDNVMSIGDRAFQDCEGFTGELILPSKMKTIESATFFGCKGLTGEIVIPDNVTEIKSYAFCHCWKISGIKLSKKLISIERSAFSSTPASELLVIPASVTSIDENAFSVGKNNIVFFEGDAPVLSDGNFDNALVIYDNRREGWSDESLNNKYGYDPSKELLVPATDSSVGAYIPPNVNDNISEAIEVFPAFASIELASSDYIYYTGEEIEPEVIVKDIHGNEINQKYYTLEYENNIYPERYPSPLITVTGVDKYAFSKSISFRIRRALLSDSGLSITDKTYNGIGGEIPFYSEKGLKEGVDFVVSRCEIWVYNEENHAYENVYISRENVKDVGRYIVVLEGIGNYVIYGQYGLIFEIVQKDINDTDLQLEKKEYYSTGESFEPTFVSSEGLKLGKDYVLSGVDTTEPGEKTIVAYGRNNYTGSKSFNFIVHTEEVIEAVAPTCTETGLTEGKRCPGCGKILVAQEEIPALGHTWDSGVITKQPTHSEAGIKTYTCTVCGETKTEDVPMLIYTGWQKLDGYWYFFDENGVMVTSEWKKDSKGWCYLGSDGRMVTNGWAKDSIGTCWIGSDGYMAAGNQWVKYNGNWYYIEKGYMAHDKWAKDSQGWCYLASDGKMVTNGWVKDSIGMCWIASNGYMPTTTQWVKYNGEWYHITKGYMDKSKWMKDSKGWCYLGADGRMVTNGWAKDSIGWCWMKSDGYMDNYSGLILHNDIQYYMENGYRVQNRWINDGSGWLYFGSDGRMVTDSWRKDSKGWCYLGSNGRMVTNGWAKDSIGYCWIGTDGYMEEVDKWIGEEGAVGSSYIIKGYRVDGKTITIDGVQYTFDKDGKLIG